MSEMCELAGISEMSEPSDNFESLLFQEYLDQLEMSSEVGCLFR